MSHATISSWGILRLQLSGFFCKPKTIAEGRKRGDRLEVAVAPGTSNKLVVAAAASWRQVERSQSGASF